MKRPINLVEIESLEYRMNNPMTLDEADRFNAELFKKNFTDDGEESNKNYEFEYDEFMEYLLLRPKDTGLPVDCFADDGGSWMGRNHPLWFLMKNGYDEDDEFIPFTVEDNPKMVGTYDLKVSQNDVNKVMAFISRNKDGLLALGNDKISNFDFLENIDTFQYRMAENKTRERVDEMARLLSSDTGLPTDIWVDQNKTYLKGGHAQRMKFNAIQGNRDPHLYSTITLNDKPPVIKNLPEKSFLNAKDLKQIKQFVINNYELLLLLGNGEINILEFKAKMIKNTK